MEDLAEKTTCDRYSDKGWVNASTHVPVEKRISIFVNRQAFVNLLCTPGDLNCLVIGYLYGEGIISGIDDVTSIDVCEDESEVDVRLSNAEVELPRVLTLTSGCTGGVAFKAEGERVASEMVISPEQVLSLMKQFQEQMDLYRISGGIHTSALADTQNLLVITEDIGRHNTLDKILGECLIKGLETRDKLILCTGRVSSEMLLKASRIQAPVIASLTSPTGRAVSLARDLGIALVGYARGNRLTVYAHPERLGR